MTVSVRLAELRCHGFRRVLVISGHAVIGDVSGAGAALGDRSFADMVGAMAAHFADGPAGGAGRTA